MKKGEEQKTHSLGSGGVTARLSLPRFRRPRRQRKKSDDLGITSSRVPSCAQKILNIQRVGPGVLKTPPFGVRVWIFGKKKEKDLWEKNQRVFEVIEGALEAPGNMTEGAPRGGQDGGGSNRREEVARLLIVLHPHSNRPPGTG